MESICRNIGDGALAAKAYLDGLDKIWLERLRVIAPKLNR
jgi:hypothetical protein